jgi:hypothetical protein
MVYVVLALQPAFALAADQPERSENSRKNTVGDHRARSSGQGGVTVANTPVVRDHRTSPIVRDHREPPIIRDHRTPAKVVDPHAKTRRPGKAPPIVRPIDPGRGDGKVVVRDYRDPPIVRDHRRPPVVRDHRDTSSSPGSTKVTNTPIVRDHRSPPVVRDHRTPVNVVDQFAKTRRPGRVPLVVRPIDPGRGDGKVVVRDHRSPVVRDHRDPSNSSGGTTVTNTPIVRDHR